MQTAQKLVQNSVITSFLVTDFIQDESTIQVITEVINEKGQLVREWPLLFLHRMYMFRHRLRNSSISPCPA